MTTTRRRQISPFQKPLFPGSQDDTRPQAKESPPRIQYGRVPSWFLALKPSGPALRFYCFAASTLANRQGVFWHKDTVIAERIGQSVRTVQRAIRELERLKALTVTPRLGMDGRNISNRYHLHFHAPAAVSEEIEDDRIDTIPVTELTPYGDRIDTIPPQKSASGQIGPGNLNQTHRNQTQVEPNVSPSLKKKPLQQSKTVDHHHQGTPAFSTPDDDDQGFDKSEELETCLGPDQEPLVHNHTTPQATARHLELFLGHGRAASLVSACGVEHINQALVELLQQKGLRNPPGWLSTRAQDLKNHAAPIPPKEKPKVERTWTERDHWNFDLNGWVMNYREANDCSREQALKILRDFRDQHEDLCPWEVSDDDSPRKRDYQEAITADQYRCPAREVLGVSGGGGAG